MQDGPFFDKILKLEPGTWDKWEAERERPLLSAYQATPPTHPPTPFEFANAITVPRSQSREGSSLVIHLSCL